MLCSVWGFSFVLLIFGARWAYLPILPFLVLQVVALSGDVGDTLLLGGQLQTANLAAHGATRFQGLNLAIWGITEERRRPVGNCMAGKKKRRHEASC